MKTLFVLGGTGFIGSVLVSEAVAAGWTVSGLARSGASADALERLGAHAVRGDVKEIDKWIGAAGHADAFVDLCQPAFPGRLTDRAVRRIADERLAITRTVTTGLESLPADARPLLYCVSGVDDLDAAGDHSVSDRSRIRSSPSGLAQIGVSVRRVVEESGLDAVYVYFGALVYGPGKVYRDVIVHGLRKHRARVLGPGSNRLPLTHVTDAARALVHIAGLPRAEIAGRTFIASDGADTTQRDLFDATADAMGVKRPGTVPAWLAGAIAGRAGVESLVLDVTADNSALRGSGFEFRYPSLREGVPWSVEQLGELAAAAG